MPQSSAHWPAYRPGGASNHVWLTLPGIASILPPSCGTHQLWITSSSGATIAQLDDAADRRAQRRRSRSRRSGSGRASRTGAPRPSIVVWSAALALGHVLDPRQLVEDERADHREDHDREHGPDHLEPRRPWICGPSAVRVRRPRRYLMTNAISAPSTSTKIERREADDQPVGVADPLGVRRLGSGGAKPPFPAYAGDGRREGDDARDERTGSCELDARRVAFYESVEPRTRIAPAART